MMPRDGAERERAMNLKGGKPETFGPIKSFFYRRWGERSLEPLYLRVAAEIPISQGRLLDVGCGPGKLDRLIAESRQSVSVVGLDASPAMIRQASRSPVPRNLEFREGAVEGAGFTEEFDFAFSLLSFHHWEEPAEGLTAVWRALRRGGRFWIYEMDPEAPIEAIRHDEAPLWGWLRLPEGIVRRGIRGHGFTRDEVDRVLGPVIAKSPFGSPDVEPTGSLLRIALRRP
jgi:SAM-dependent methyltransferase